MKGLQQLFVAHGSSDLDASYWGRNSDGAIVYQQFANDSHTGPAVRLLAQGGHFEAVLRPSDHGQQLFVASQQGHITVLQQNPIDRVWETQQLNVPSLNQLIVFSAFVSHIHITESATNYTTTTAPIVSGKVLLCCSSGLLDGIVNGKSVSIGEHGVEVTTDCRGNITVVVPADDIATHLLIIKDVAASSSSTKPILQGKQYVIDPAKKVKDRLATVHSGDDLRNVTLPDGSKLLDGSTASSEDVNAAAAAISKMHSRATTSASSASSAQPAVVSHTVVLAAKAVALSSNAVKHALWDAWHWVESEWKTVTKWIIEEAEGAWNFVIHIGKEIWRFVLDTAHRVMKAISWLLKTIGVAFKKLVQWLGWLFNWDDILKMHKIIVQNTNDMMQLGIDKIDTIAHEVDGWFVSFEDLVRNWSMPESMKKIEVSEQNARDSISTPDEYEKAAAAANSPGGNWSNYQIEHGAILDDDMPNGESRDSNPLKQVWNDVIQPTIKSIEESASKIGEDIVELFRKNKSFTVEELLQKLGSDVLLAFIDVIRRVVVGMMHLLKDLIRDFKALVNLTINVRVLSPLYKSIAKSDLTLLDAFALLVAIPVTVIAKATPLGKNMFAKSHARPWVDAIPAATTARSNATPARVSEVTHPGVVSRAVLPSGVVAAQTLDVPNPAADKEPSTPPPVPQQPDSIKLFSQFGGFIAMGASVLGTVVKVLKFNSEVANEGMKGKILTVAEGCFGLIAVAGTFPLTPNDGLQWQRAAWGFDCAEFVINAVVLEVIVGRLMLAGYFSETVESVTGSVTLAAAALIFAMQIGGAVKQLQKSGNTSQDKVDASLQIISAAISCTGKVGEGLSKVLKKKKPEAAVIAQKIGLLVSSVSAVVELGRVIAELCQGRGYIPAVNT